MSFTCNLSDNDRFHCFKPDYQERSILHALKEGRITQDDALLITAFIESVNRCLNPLSLVSTTDLVAELCSREGVSMPFTISEMYSVTINHEIEFMDPYEVCGPAKIIVVRGE